MNEDRIMNAIDELIEDMRDMIGERDTIQSERYFEEWLQDLMFLGDMAGNILREITDPESIPNPVKSAKSFKAKESKDYYALRRYSTLYDNLPPDKQLNIDSIRIREAER